MNNLENISTNQDLEVENNEDIITISLTSSDTAQEILDSISDGKTVELDINKDSLINNLNAFLLAEAYSQLPTIIKLHKLQTKCLDKYYEQVNELIDDDDANTFMLEKIINTLNESIDRCNNMIFKLGLNSNVTSQLMIKHVDNSKNVNVFQSQLSKQRVISALDKIITLYENPDQNITLQDASESDFIE